jgi:hypothetical protein
LLHWASPNKTKLLSDLINTAKDFVKNEQLIKFSYQQTNSPRIYKNVSPSMSFDLPDAIELKKITEDKYSEIVYQKLRWLYKWIQNIDLYRQSIYLSLAITFHTSAKTK